MREVLIVDDDPDIRALLAFTLEDGGYAVREAADGTQALTALEDAPPDAMVLDVMMPSLDGFGVLRALRQRELAPDTRVMLLTCKTEERDFVRGWELGVDEYLTKPFDPDALVRKLGEMLAAPADELQQRRREELRRAELLDRLETAFVRGRGRTRTG